MIDLLVAGGGPAGLVTALHAARAGLTVTVIERRSPPIDKACGEGLMPHAVAQLDKLGITVPGKPFRGVTYLDSKRCVDAPLRADPGLGVRRTALHSALVDAAGAAGVDLVTAHVGSISQDSGSVQCAGFRARYLAAADGLHSTIRRSLGLARPSRGPRRWGLRRHVHTAPWSDRVEVYWGDGAEAYVTPVADDCVGIAILTARQGSFESRLGEFGALSDRVDGHPHGSERAAGPLRQRVAGRSAGRVMLVGDAAGYVDALTGEGLGIGFGGAELLVNCVLADRPGDYDRQWRHMSRRYRMLTAGLLHATEYGTTRSRVVPAAAAFPGTFAKIVNLLAY
ncbi:NAD(P)/FAD-dependent oxidoreductase [Mycobacterium sp. CVI_P3]|uniref:NAD(P)/FAD-dependent oxidoreductase n=1 Tax=Mycobacterium pinniadriaticum TaxID=2994102 RepID=A0ABT3SFF1_9MYCO|nr:NAD(P)/FAD-dependent oxidoreductase [Mycobacterium pinniadriaticum]MCX2931164.1 NAD(P)/FAD-dependent oxidoreductase [Mycobacterium pinniadriaticum]MCX2937612.1 NAD(P)/FAD-dependent oxidoreductase [Mycobacterium pinniadriaticum]